MSPNSTPPSSRSYVAIALASDRDPSTASHYQEEIKRGGEGHVKSVIGTDEKRSVSTERAQESPFHRRCPRYKRERVLPPSRVLLRGCGQWYRCGRERVARPSEEENLDPQPQRNRRRQEDVSKGEPSRGQTGLHSRSSDLTSELQSSVRSDEVVIATEQFHVLIELLRRASVGKRSSRKVCRALPDGQIQPLDERRVQC